MSGDAFQYCLRDQFPVTDSAMIPIHIVLSRSPP
jgi:hypothetical protein